MGNAIGQEKGKAQTDSKHTQVLVQEFKVDLIITRFPITHASPGTKNIILNDTWFIFDHVIIVKVGWCDGVRNGVHG